MEETPPAATTAERAAACLSTLAVPSGARCNSFALARIERRSISPHTGLDLLCATPTPQDVFCTTGKYDPFAFTMSRAWIHTAGKDTDDEADIDPLTPPRSPRASHQKTLRRRHGHSYHDIFAVQAMQAQLKTLEKPNRGPVPLFVTPCSQLTGRRQQGPPPTRRPTPTAHHRAVLPRSHANCRNRRQVRQSRSPYTVSPQASDAQLTTKTAADS